MYEKNYFYCCFSCDVFFATKVGRWNIFDPDNELENFYPTVDGYVQNTDPGWEEKLNLCADPGLSVILIRFNEGNMPEAIAASYLWLNKTSTNGTCGQLEIYRIIQPWDGSITYSVANTPGDFYDEKAVVNLALPGSPEEMLIPLTDIFSGSKEKLANGIIIISFDETAEFDSSEMPNPPVLLLEPG